MDSRKVLIKETRGRGQGVFAKEMIGKGELIAAFDGPFYDADSVWDQRNLNHAIQFEQEKWRDSAGLARVLNHSCEPNCGIKNLFEIVAMRDIATGEELTWDYEMTENNQYGWQMACKCGTASCRNFIGRYENMPQEVRERYAGYISEWLLQK